MTTAIRYGWVMRARSARSRVPVMTHVVRARPRAGAEACTDS